jgi:hypothetical protein
LLTMEQKAHGFLERPAIEMAAEDAIREHSDDGEAAVLRSGAVGWVLSTKRRILNWAARSP